MPPSAIDLRRGRVSEIGRIYLITAVTLDRVPLFEDLALARTAIAHLRHAVDNDLGFPRATLGQGGADLRVERRIERFQSSVRPFQALRMQCLPS